MAGVMERPTKLIDTLAEGYENGEAEDWEEYTREERYLMWDVKVLLDYIEYLENKPKGLPLSGQTLVDYNGDEYFVAGHGGGGGYHSASIRRKRPEDGQ